MSTTPTQPSETAIETPLTNQFLNGRLPCSGLEVELIEHARSLERELLAALEENGRLKDAVDETQTLLTKSVLECSDLRTSRDEALAACGKMRAERDTALQQARELEERVRGLEEALQASKRLASNNYVNWANAGGPDECAHGYSKGIPCPKCDAITLEEVLAKPASVPSLLPIGTKIRFLKQLTAPASGDHPDLVYAKKGDLGEITAHGCPEGYWVKRDGWPPFGASRDEFEVASVPGEGERA